MIEEIWKDVKGYEGLYQVSNLGRVRRLPRSFDRVIFDKQMRVDLIRKVLKINRKRKKYKAVYLLKNDQGNQFSLAKLVAEHFVDNPNNFKCVFHKDGNKSNCCADNLVWGKHPVNETLKKPVRITKDDFVKEFDSKKECCDFFNCTYRCLNYRRDLFGDKFEFRGYMVELN